MSQIESKILPTFESWRDAARVLLRRQADPEQIIWSDGSEAILPMLASASNSPENAQGQPTASVPRDFISVAKTVSYHCASQRWALLYRILFRLTHGERNLLKISTDDDVHRLYAMEKSVRRDLHKMHAFVRFRRVEQQGHPHYIAFHRSDHLIMPAAAPWFARRFANMAWTILTPDASAAWDTHTLRYGPGAARSPVNEDDLENLWKTYYRNIFNPARIKIGAMKKEMPVRHWATLPETQLIPELLKSAPARVNAMTASSEPPAGVGVSAAAFIPRTTELAVHRDASQSCRGCELYCDATQAVFGRGPDHAVLMFVGEQPGEQEDLAGLPFVGPAGEVLNQALLAAGIDRQQCYITNAVKHFRFEMRGKRRVHSKPSARHVAACRPWLEAEIALVQPRMIIALGSTAAGAVIGPTIHILRDRGKIFRDTSLAPWVMATIHPSALLRMPDENQRAIAHQQFIADLRIAALQLQNKEMPAHPAIYENDPAQV